MLGGHAIVKVRASQTTLDTIAADADIVRIPVSALDNTLASLTNAQKNAIRNKLQALGYTLAELNARFPNDLGTYTVRDVLRFAATRRFKKRWDGAQFIYDGVLVIPTQPDEIDFT